MMRWLSTIKKADDGKLVLEKMELDETGFPQPTGELDELESDSLPAVVPVSESIDVDGDVVVASVSVVASPVSVSVPSTVLSPQATSEVSASAVTRIREGAFMLFDSIAMAGTLAPRRRRDSRIRRPIDDRQRRGALTCLS